jgi:hypothetical protein
MQIEFMLLVMILTLCFIAIPLHIFNLKEQRQIIWQVLLVLLIVITVLACIACYKILQR